MRKKDEVMELKSKAELVQLTDEELLLVKKEHKKSRTMHAFGIGFLVGILIFGVGSWIINPDKQLGFLFPMLILVFFIYKALKNNKKNEYADLLQVLKERGLD